MGRIHRYFSLAAILTLRVQSAWDNLDWRLHVGFLGPGNIPHIWNAEKECWLPVTESMTASQPGGADP